MLRDHTNVEEERQKPERMRSNTPSPEGVDAGRRRPSVPEGVDDVRRQADARETAAEGSGWLVRGSASEIGREGLGATMATLSRADLDRRRAMKQWQLATVYVVFQALYFLNNLATYRLAGFPFDALPVQIFYSEVPVVTWFLFALAAWRTLLPVLVLLRAPLRLSLVVAHLALYVDLRMNYQHLLSFLPYFLGGFYLPPSLWALLARPAPRLALGGAFVAATAASILWSWLSPDADGGFAAAFRRVSVTYNCFNGVAPSDEPAARRR